MDAAKARKHMVDSQVRPNDVTDVRLQSAMATLPRERFVPANRKTLAYVERDVSLFEGRALLKAREFSKLVHAANIQSDEPVAFTFTVERTAIPINGVSLGTSTIDGAASTSIRTIDVSEREDLLSGVALDVRPLPANIPTFLPDGGTVKV
ncbi:MAG: hypothetical protein AAF511_03790, partial [Pseudomonadota bacterium]